MKPLSWKIYRNLGFGMLSAVLILTVIITVLTYMYRDSHFSNPVVMFAITHHLEIMIGMALISAIFGFTLASISSSEIEKKTAEGRNVMDVLLLFLGADERDILNFLVHEGGETSQAEISRLKGMGRVRAYRALQRMQAKGMLSIESHGKVRRVCLKENIRSILTSERSSSA